MLKKLFNSSGDLASLPSKWFAGRLTGSCASSPPSISQRILSPAVESSSKVKVPQIVNRLTRQSLQRGIVIPACPLALTRARKLDERRQRALFRYYIAAGAGGLAVGVHTTQFAIRDPKIGLFRPVLELAAEEMNRAKPA